MTTKITEQNISNLANIGVQWQSVFTGDGSTGLTAVAGRGYFIDTTSGTVTVTLPASPSAGDVVVLKDYARNWGTNNVTLASALFDGAASQTPSFSTSGQTVTLVYMDGTKGWSLINDDTTGSLGAEFISATGGTVTESGDYKIHSFTGDGCFVVSSVGNPAGSTSVDYLVVAGGGAGSGNPNANSGGGGGAGGFREGYNPGSYCASPLATSALPVSATTYPITVGAGGAGALNTIGTNGSSSVFSTITSAGGGRGGGPQPGGPAGGDGASGGSGGGAGGGSPAGATGGTGNSPPVSPPQGNNGGNTPSGLSPDHQSSAGGGAGGVGGSGSPTSGGTGGVGVSTSITGSPLAYSGGGGGTGFTGSGGPSPCGTGGNGVIGNGSTGCAGTANRGGGGGAAEGYCGGPGNGTGGAGGKGVVVIRYKFQ